MGSHVKPLPRGHAGMPGKLIINVICGVTKERLLLVHEGFPRVTDCGREILIPSFCNGNDWVSNSCIFPFFHYIFFIRAQRFMQSGCMPYCIFQKTSRCLLTEGVCKMLRVMALLRYPGTAAHVLPCC